MDTLLWLLFAQMILWFVGKEEDKKAEAREADEYKEKYPHF